LSARVLRPAILVILKSRQHKCCIVLGTQDSPHFNFLTDTS